MHYLLSFILFFGVTFCAAAQSQTLLITTGEWQPYINKEHQPNGSAAALLTKVLSQNNTQISWLYQDYELAYAQIANQEKLLSFPYFKTQARQEKVLFSAPVFYATSYLYYNRQYNQQTMLTQLANYRLGRVAGYSYGESMDELLSNAQEFSSEKQALLALLSHKIDFLPMTESVMNNMLNNEFSAQKLLIQSLTDVKDTASLHVIAAKNTQGQAIIKQVNNLLAKVTMLTSFKLEPELLKTTPDIAKLVTSEGHPAILGQSGTPDQPHYFTLPQGTKVLVIEWSNKMLISSKTDSIYRNMMDLSKVLVLNGPLVGKELLVKNMHLELL